MLPSRLTRRSILVGEASNSGGGGGDKHGTLIGTTLANDGVVYVGKCMDPGWSVL